MERCLFDDAWRRIEEFLAAGSMAGGRGVAVFSRSGDSRFFLPLRFRVPVPAALSVDSVPNICQLVELDDTYYRYAVLLATEDNVRILGVNLGSVTEDIRQQRPTLRRRVGREWTKLHFQRHRSERLNQFLNEQI